MRTVVDVFGSDEVERARRYHRPLYLAAVAGLALDLAALSVLSFTAVGGWLDGGTDGWAWPARTAAYSAIVLTLLALVGWPLGFWTGYAHEHAWSLSTQTAGGWLSDRLKALAVNLVLGTGVLLGLVAAVHAWPAAWPLVVGAAAAALTLALAFLAPVVLEPLFNRFRPLADPELHARLLELAEQAGVPVRRVLVADAGRRTRKLNAYVSGLGHSRRIVVYDTLLAGADRRELQLVVAHELGHRRARHVARGTVLGMAGAVVFVVVAWALLRWPALRSAISAAGPGDPRVVPFLLLLGSALGLLTSPFGAAISRRWERQADAFSLALTRDLHTFESTHRRLALANLSDLDPPRAFYLAWFSHPTAPERIAAARALRPDDEASL